MFIVITGLDGSGTTTIANGLHKIDPNSKLFKTPSNDYSDKNKIDEITGIREKNNNKIL